LNSQSIDFFERVASMRNAAGAKQPMLIRNFSSTEHDMLRDAARKFFEREVAPDHRRREKKSVALRPVWQRAGTQGRRCVNMPETHGAAAVLIEEPTRRPGRSRLGFAAHSDIDAPNIKLGPTPACRAASPTSGGG